MEESVLDQLKHSMRPFDWGAIHPEVLARCPGLPRLGFAGNPRAMG